jgi:polyisoprenyl-phosphate glycosyltransferase
MTLEKDVQSKRCAKTLSIVIPCYNEEDVLPHLRKRLVEATSILEPEIEFVLINDGSKDKTLEYLRSYHEQDPRFKYLSLSRNFGHQKALSCGLDFCTGDIIVILDADLQDPPELIPKMIDLWSEGFDVVYGQRTTRHGESVLKRGFAFAFYRIFERIIGIKVPRDSGDFRLMDRRALEAFKKLREPHRFVRGMVSWIGFKQIPLPYERPNREHGETKYPFRKSLFLAIDAITSFSYAPLRLATYLGVVLSALSFFYILIVVGLKITLLTTGIHIAETPGYTSLMATLLLLGGVQLIFLGLIGEYIGRIFEQGQNRPLYLLEEEGGFVARE